MKSMVLSLLFAGSGLVCLANAAHGPITHLGESNAEVKYIASNDGGLYDVLYANNAGGRFSVSILDEAGNQLYQGVFSDRQFDKKFRIADPDSFGKLVFVIRNFSDNTIQRFEVKADSRQVEDITVKEVH